ncbi:metallophosphoesterase family protein [Loktanella sp. DJP18]|uniref:metallophosphoesterase family protein n=1 Tax=Loktanella sp. DJP18 TaxID=3409788 RepID=UPI003BB63431
MITTDWRKGNGFFFDDQTFAIGDVHGQAEALGVLLDHLHGLPAPMSCVTKTREMVFLGDLIDRGPDSIGSVAHAFACFDRFDRVHLLPGNHELMLLSAMNGNARAKALWARNGGMAMVQEVDPQGLLGLDEAIAALRARLPTAWTAIYGHGPTHLRRGTLGDVLFVHAGINPEWHLDTFLELPRFAIDDNHWAWMRQPFLSWEGGWGHMGLNLVVHGHSPATVKPIGTRALLLRLLDSTDHFACICLDAGSLRLPQVAAVEFAGENFRLHLVAAPETSLS